MNNFNEVVEEICKELEYVEASKLRNLSGIWNPEWAWRNLSVWINRHVKVESTSSKSVKIYSLMYNESEESIKRWMENWEDEKRKYQYRAKK